MLTQSTTQKLLFGIYIIVVCVSLLICIVEFRALGFDRVDYAFYLEFSSKLLDGHSAHIYSLNPEGRNWLFMTGAEGISNFQQTLHFEPIKYVYAFLYKVFNTPYILFIFIALILFIPLPYMALVLPMNSQTEMRSAITLGILYVLSPSAMYAPTFDLRPYIFLAPFFFLAILSIQVERPIWEQVLWFNALFLTREEAILLGAVILLFKLAKKRNRSLRPSALIPLCISYGVWTIITATFMYWTGYPTAIKQHLSHIFTLFMRLATLHPLLFMAIILGGAVILAVSWILWKNSKKYPQHFQTILEALPISTVFFMLGYQTHQEYKPGTSIEGYFYSPRYFLHYLTLILFIAIILGYNKSNISKRIWLGLMGITVATIILINTLSPYGLLKTYAEFSRATQDTNVIWAYKENLDPYKSNLLVDYATRQAFYNFENIYVYNRLPWSVLDGRKRYYPSNRQMVLLLINQKINFIVISRASINDINTILAGSSMQRKVVFENEQFIGLEIIR